MKTEVREFVSSKRFAIVGVSRDRKKFGNTIYHELRNRGYEVYGVNPSVREINGEMCYPNVGALRGKIDAAVICVKPDQVASVLRDVSDAGLRHVWLQQGAESRVAIELGKSLGLNVVSGRCILMYAEPVDSVHSFHRFFVKLFGRY